MGDFVNVNITTTNNSITKAIKAKLQEDDRTKDKQITGNIWTNIMNAVAEENESATQKLYSGGSNFVLGNSTEAKASWKENFIVQTGTVIKLSQNLWNKIVGFVTGQPVATTTTPPAATTPATPTTPAAPTIPVTTTAQPPEQHVTTGDDYTSSINEIKSSGHSVTFADGTKAFYSLKHDNFYKVDDSGELVTPPTILNDNDIGTIKPEVEDGKVTNIDAIISSLITKYPDSYIYDAGGAYKVFVDGDEGIEFDATTEGLNKAIQYLKDQGIDVSDDYMISEESAADEVDETDEVDKTDEVDDSDEVEDSDEASTNGNRFKAFIPNDPKTLKLTDLRIQHDDLKTQTRMIDGKKQEYVMYKNENGETVRIIIHDDGKTENLVEIADHGKKQFVTESKLKAAIGQATIPEGVKCKCDNDGNLTFSINGKNATTDEVKEFIQNGVHKTKVEDNGQIQITPEIRTKIQSMKPGVSNTPKYSIDERGIAHRESDVSVSVLSSSNYQKYYNIDGGAFTDWKNSKRATVLTRAGIKPGNSFNIMQMQYSMYLQDLFVNQSIYQDLSNKKPEELTDAEKKFMQNHEQSMARLMEVAGDLKTARK